MKKLFFILFLLPACYVAEQQTQAPVQRQKSNVLACYYYLESNCVTEYRRCKKERYRGCGRSYDKCTYAAATTCSS